MSGGLSGGGAPSRPATSPRPAALSLRARVLVGLGAIAAVAAIVAVAVTAITHSFLVAQLDERLASFSGPVLGDRGRGPDDATGDHEAARPSDVLRGMVLPSGDYQVFYAPNVEGADDSIPVLSVSDLPASGSVYVSVPSSDGSGQYRVLARATSFGTDITALSLDGVEATTRQLIIIEGLGIAGMLVGLGAVGWWVIRLGIAPMRRMVDASARIADGDLQVRLEGMGHGSESAELAGSLNRMIGTLTDALEERERSEARLRAFVADASHELRTPLTTVLGYAELYRRGALRRDEDVADAWSRTEAEASRMRRLVEDMLELARYDSEPQILTVDVDLEALAAEVVGDTAAAHPEATVTITGGEAGAGSVTQRDGEAGAEGAPGIVPGKTAVAVPVSGDPDRLRQAVINVVTNAVLHGGTVVDVTVTARDGRAIVRVTDNGPGMPESMVARATERFVRGDGSRTRATGGAGLGLAITSAIVAVHAGTLAVESTEGEGTTVTIDLPLAPLASTLAPLGSPLA